jgi:hypothetical protein
MQDKAKASKISMCCTANQNDPSKEEHIEPKTKNKQKKQKIFLMGAVEPADIVSVKKLCLLTTTSSLSFEWKK